MAGDGDPVQLTVTQDTAGVEPMLVVTVLEEGLQIDRKSEHLLDLGRLDTFPDDDIGARNSLQRLFHLTDKPAYDHLRHLTSP
jgi:hypothetical protein